jgi:hypothetical protein
MDLRLAIVTTAGPADCTLRWLDETGEHSAHYSPAMQGRIRVVPTNSSRSTREPLGSP